MTDVPDFGNELSALIAFLEAGSLTESIAALEHELADASTTTIGKAVARRGISPDVLRAALFARSKFGRLNDVIHAAGIALALPYLLNDGETLKRPSLAAGNDKSRPFDVETNQRAMEFKFARWDGHDAMRKRGVVKDLVHLAELEGQQTVQLYVLGSRPLKFLAGSRANMGWALDRAPATRARFPDRFGTLDQTVATFYGSVRDRVEIIDLEQRLPDLFPMPTEADSTGSDLEN